MKHIAVVGSLNLDLVVRVDRLAAPGETRTGSDLALFDGGKGANQACAAGLLGGAVAMIGQVGADAFGERLIASLAGNGVDVAGIGRAAASTGTAIISVLPDGENAIVISPGANATLTSALVTDRLKAVPDLAAALFQLETPLDGIAAGLREAKSRRAITILDPAPFQPIPESVRASVDLVTPNQSEALALIGQPAATLATPADAERVAKQLRDQGFAGVIVKLGALGCYLDTPAERGFVAGFAVAAVDTTAAGDTFNAAFAVALTEGHHLLTAARFANAAAALSVTRPGAQASMPRRSEVDQFLRQHPSEE